MGSRVHLSRLAAAAIALTLAVGAAALEAPRQAAAADQPPAEGQVRSSTATALAAAEQSDRRVEDLSQRTETTQVFVNPDGTYTSEQATEPVRVQDDTGAWNDIDTDLVQVDGGIAPKSAIGGLVLSDGGDKTFAAMDPAGRGLEWRWPTPLPKPQISGNVATYPNVVDNGDLVVTALGTGFKHDIVLREAPEDPVTFTIPIVTGGPKVTEEKDGSLAVTTKSGDELVNAAEPVMYDATVDNFGDPVPLPVNATVTNTSTGGTLKLTPDFGFLDDPSTVYPVTVDPVWSAAPSGDTYVTTTNPTTNYGDSPELRVGTPNAGANKARAFVRFNTDVAPWNGSNIISATLTMNNFESSTCSGGVVRAYRLTEQFYATGATWENQPKATTYRAVDSTTARGASGCPGGPISWDVSSITRVWAKNLAEPFGFRISGVNENATNTWRRLRSANYTTDSAKPSLTVNYNFPPNLPTDLVVPAVSSPTAPSVASARLTDKDGDLLTATFVVSDDNDPDVALWRGTVRQTTPNSTVSLALPLAYVKDGSAYQVAVTASDGTNSSRTAFAYFDRTPPSAEGGDPPATPDPAAPVMTPFGVDSYELEDLEKVAQEEGISLQQSVDRYGWQSKFDDALNDAADSFPDSYSDATISETSASAQVVFEGAVPSGAAAKFAAFPNQVTLVGGAPYSDADRAALVDAAGASLESQVNTEDSFTVEIDDNNRLVAIVHSPDLEEIKTEERETAAADRVVVPPTVISANGESATLNIEFTDRPTGFDQAIRGGVKIGRTNIRFDCTSGFVASRDGVFGVLTAAHCPDTMAWYDSEGDNARVRLKDAIVMDRSYGDIQFHPVEGESLAPQFYYAVGKARRVTGLGKVAKGKKVCVFGRTSKNKSTCSTISRTNVSSKVSGKPRYHQIVRTKKKMGTAPGDSGGPVYWGGKAFGIHRGSGRSLRDLNYAEFTPVRKAFAGMRAKVYEAGK